MTRMRSIYLHSKRMIDVLLSLGALLLLSPLLVVLAVIARASMGQSVLFRAKRAGLRGKPFILLKFRSMSDARDAAGNLLPDDQRLTPFGRFIRRSSLDELPQLLNVLKGDMSIVGPRPLPMEYNALYDHRQARRLDVKPGLTGWCQVQYRGNDRTWEQKFEQDLYYVDHQGMRLDLFILMRTAIAVGTRLVRNGAGLSTSPTFAGSPARNGGPPS